MKKNLKLNLPFIYLFIINKLINFRIEKIASGIFIEFVKILRIFKISLKSIIENFIIAD